MSETIIIPSDDYIGAIKLNSEWRFFYERLGAWFLDYEAYTDYRPSSPDDWRFGLMQVNETNAEQYCQSMKDRELTTDQIPHVFYTGGPHWSKSRAELTFVVNFDERIFVSGWHDMILIHDYAPKGWTALEGRAIALKRNSL